MRSLRDFSLGYRSNDSSAASASVARSLSKAGTPIIPSSDITLVDYENPLGTGSFGVVFRGIAYMEDVAVKLLFEKPDNFASPENSTRFMKSLCDEVTMLAELHHANVISFRGVCLDPPCILTEYCPRGSLYDVLKIFRGPVWDDDSLGQSQSPQAPRHKKKKMKFDQKLKIALGIAKGMYFLHKRYKPVLHRDLKSPNVVLREDWTAVVTDFGMARYKPTRLDFAVNPIWLSPEMMNNEEPCKKSDVFSFAIIMWELLTGNYPWDGRRHEQILYAVLIRMKRPEIPQETVNSDAARAYVELMEQCWAQERQDRPDFYEIVQQLQHIYQELNPNLAMNAQSPLMPLSRLTGPCSPHGNQEHIRPASPCLSWNSSPPLNDSTEVPPDSLLRRVMIDCLSFTTCVASFPCDLCCACIHEPCCFCCFPSTPPCKSDPFTAVTWAASSLGELDTPQREHSQSSLQASLQELALSQFGRSQAVTEISKVGHQSTGTVYQMAPPDQSRRPSTTESTQSSVKLERRWGALKGSIGTASTCKKEEESTVATVAHKGVQPTSTPQDGNSGDAVENTPKGSASLADELGESGEEEIDLPQSCVDTLFTLPVPKDGDEPTGTRPGGGGTTVDTPHGRFKFRRPEDVIADVYDRERSSTRASGRNAGVGNVSKASLGVVGTAIPARETLQAIYDYITETVVRDVTRGAIWEEVIKFAQGWKLNGAEPVDDAGWRGFLAVVFGNCGGDKSQVRSFRKSAHWKVLRRHLVEDLIPEPVLDSLPREFSMASLSFDGEVVERAGAHGYGRPCT
ncbi:hypothetical protein BSKO_12681 [Bryopsis sp. KO-2023]|nr:hypothetical protein BSKO_12681 [Bryopsis sp. KO-2023]